MPSRSFFGRSAASLINVGHMPVITEDDSAAAAAREKAAADAAAAGGPPKTPQKSYRRGLLSRSTAMPPPPPYMPALHLPPRYRERNANGLAWNGARLRKGGSDSDEETRGARWWFPENRKRRWGCYGGLLALIVIIIVALAVGLTVGMKDDDDKHNSSNSDDDAADTPDLVFPAGSYSLNTTLQDASTDCTSNPSTWRCYPYDLDAKTTFFLIITSVNETTFNISSTDYSGTPTFDNVTTPLLDAGKPTERLSLRLPMDKAVIPDSMLSEDNRISVCTFADTEFAATLWTRRRDGESIDLPKEASSSFGVWTGDIEVAQTVGKTAPRCEDNDGKAVADVKAGSGDCACRYASFEL